MATTTCPRCQSPLIGDDSSFCEECGHRLTAPCLGCGGLVISDDGYCESCGLRQPSGRDHLEVELAEVVAVTDRGLRHARNEDAMAVAAFDDHVVAVVCDGVSASPRPEDASQTAADTAVELLRSELAQGAQPLEASRAAVLGAAKAVAGLAESPAHAPACTYTCAVVTPAGVTVSWVGDSRVYWLAEDASAKLTEDDSLAVAMAESTGVPIEEALMLPNGHALMSWLGADAGELDPHVESFVPDRPGTVLVCSDGLWNDVPDPDALHSVVAAAETPVDAARTLVKMALDAGGHDNITVALVPVGGTHD